MRTPGRIHLRSYQFDAARSEIREDVLKRQRHLPLELPFKKGLTIPEISDLTVQLARIYANVSEKTIQRDM